MVRVPGLALTKEAQVEEFLIRARERHLTARPKFASRTRAITLLKAVDALEEKRQEIIGLVMDETGKSQELAAGEFEAAMGFARQCAHSCTDSVGNLLTSTADTKFVAVDRVPFGPAVLITSFNTPLPNFFWKFAPSYLAGNASLLCPSAHVARSAAYVASVLLGAGISSNDLAITDGNPWLAEAATKNRSVKLISFTGSNIVGSKVSENAANHHPKLILELGGTNPLIVGKTENLDGAISAAISSAFSNGGQRCAAGSIVAVREELIDRFRQGFEAQLQNEHSLQILQAGNTPLVDDAARKRHALFLARAVREGASVQEFPDLAIGLASRPAVVWNLGGISELLHEELFSPVMRVITYREFTEIVAFLNRLPLRLTAAVWTDSLAELDEAKNFLDFGLLNFNGPTFGAESNFPFGGMGGSGNGSRDAGFNALETYSQSRIWTLVS